MKRPGAWVEGALLGLCLLLYLWAPQPRDFWVPDEPRYAAIAEGMVGSGDWLLPRLNGSIYSDKPPLYFWVLALLRWLWGGSPTWLMVLPAALSATACVLLVARLGRRQLGARAGLFAGLVLATAGLWLGLAQAVRMDIPFTLFVSLALFRFLEAWLGRGGAGTWPPGHGFWFWLGLAVLTKGPVGLLVPVLVVVTFLALEGSLGSLRDLRPGPGLALTLGLVLLWLVPALVAGGAPYASAIFLKQTLHRAVRSWAHREPPWFYLARLPLVTFPWLPLLLAALLDRPPRPEPQRSTRRFLLCWLAVWLGFFSALSGKLEVYLLPMFPPLALMVGALVADATGAGAPRRPRRLLLGATAVVALLLLAAGWLLASGGLGDAPYLGGAFASLLFLSAGALVLAASLLGRPLLAMLGAVAFMVVTLVYAKVALVAVVDARLSGRDLAARVAAPGAARPPLLLYRMARPELSFWLGPAPIPTVEDAARVREFLERSPEALCLAGKGDFDQLRVRDGLEMKRHAELRLGHDRLVLFRLAGQR